MPEKEIKSVVPENLRGLDVIPLSKLSVRGETRDGTIIKTELGAGNFFQLDPWTAETMATTCAPIAGVVHQRCTKAARAGWSIETRNRTHIIDEFASGLEHLNYLYDLKGDSPADLGAKLRIWTELKKELPDLFPDLSNFPAEKKWWLKRQRSASSNDTAGLEMWLSNPANLGGLAFDEFIKTWTRDYMIHRAASIYKQQGPMGELAGLKMLPGGSVFRLPPMAAGLETAYLQVPLGCFFAGGAYGYVEGDDVWLGGPGSSAQSQISKLYFRTELSHSQYLPSTNWADGVSPLDALIDAFKSHLRLSGLFTESSDGTRSPEKAIIMGTKLPRMNLTEDSDNSSDAPLQETEHIRIERALNDKTRDTIVKILSRLGDATVVDLSHNDKATMLLEWENKVEQLIALVYGATMQEVNRTDSGGTSGRSTSEANERAESTSGMGPIYVGFENALTENVFRPYKPWAVFRMQSGLSDKERAEIAAGMLASGLSLNETRDRVWEAEAVEGDEYDKPATGGTPAQQIGSGMESLLSSRKT